ncbi:MAG: sugar ABC transporter substrate-binding protein [Gaiellaceae bacterium MAG52_C11]|nr:sugar ABC transporter substrate-binding protein [Candidatus Gaiellasilicea maunaloa]
MERDTEGIVDSLTAGKLSRRVFVARASALGLSAGAISSILAACGGDDEGGGGDTPQSGSGSEPADLAGSLVLYKGPFSAEEPKQVSALLAAFGDKFPSVEVKREQFDWEAMATQFPTKFLSDSPPDVNTVPEIEFIKWVPRGVFEDLTPYVTDPSWKSEFDAIPTAFWDLAKSPDGKIYGVPWWGVILSMLFLNKDLLAEAGVTDVNSSFAAFHTAAQKVGELDGDAFGFSIRTTQFNPAAFDWAAWLHAAGADLLNEARTACAANTAEAQQAFQMLSDMQAKEKLSPAPGAYDEDGLRGLFQAGRVAIHHGDNGYVHVLTGEPPDFEWDVAAIPRGPADEHPTGMFGIGHLTMSSKSENKDAAWELIKHLGSADVVAQYFEEVALLPGRTDLADRMYKDDPYTQKVLQDILPGVQGWRLHPKINEMLQRSQASFDALYAGDKTAEQALEEVCSVVENTI